MPNSCAINYNDIRFFGEKLAGDKTFDPIEKSSIQLCLNIIPFCRTSMNFGTPGRRPIFNMGFGLIGL